MKIIVLLSLLFFISCSKDFELERITFDVRDAITNAPLNNVFIEYNPRKGVDCIRVVAITGKDGRCTVEVVSRKILNKPSEEVFYFSREGYENIASASTLIQMIPH
jgi:hypothetical protein